MQNRTFLFVTNNFTIFFKISVGAFYERYVPLSGSCILLFTVYGPAFLCANNQIVYPSKADDWRIQ